MTRSRRTRAQIEQLEQQIYDVLREDHPQSVRHVFYRMTDPRLPEPVEKTEAGYVAVQRRLVEMRRNGTIPYGWLTDATRRGYFAETFRSPADALRQTARFYRKSIWDQNPDYVEVWCESRSIAGTIMPITDKWAVPLYPSGGFTSLTLAYQAAEHMAEEANGRPTTILYIGDYDPAGVLIDKKVEAELRRHAPDVDLNFRRIAITPEQIDLMGLPTKPAKDSRGGFTGGTVEAEAMPARILRELLEYEIDLLVDPDVFATVQVAEQSERAFLTDLAQVARRR